MKCEVRTEKSENWVFGPHQIAEETYRRVNMTLMTTLKGPDISKKGFADVQRRARLKEVLKDTGCVAAVFNESSSLQLYLRLLYPRTKDYYASLFYCVVYISVLYNYLSLIVSFCSVSWMIARVWLRLETKTSFTTKNDIPKQILCKHGKFIYVNEEYTYVYLFRVSCIV